MELLIVIGLLGFIATLIIPQFAGTRNDAIEPVIQSELAEIQRAFLRFKNDYNLRQEDYFQIAKYGVSVLLTNRLADADKDDFYLTEWDADRQRGWRGPYLHSEHERNIDITKIGQPEGRITVPVILTPDQNTYYRIIATDKNNNVIIPSQDKKNQIHQLWLVYPYDVTQIKGIPESNEPERKYYRKLIAETE